MFIPEASNQDILREVDNLDLPPGQVVMLLVAEHQRPDITDLIQELNARKIEFFGGIFPGLIHGDQRHDRGTLLTPFPARTAPVLITGLDSPEFLVPGFASVSDPVGSGDVTAVVLVDGLTANVSLLLSRMYSHLGNRVHYIGGGAGSLSLRQEPCVFTKDGFHQDAAVVAFLSLGSNLGVRHGWQRLHGPVVATRTHGNVIEELNWKTAFDVYKEVTEADCGIPLTRENCFEVSNSYPFGIAKEGFEDVVRDPIAVGESGSLICVGEVPENAVLNILKGTREVLVDAAAQAASDCQLDDGKTARHAVVVDCVSRTIFLERDFDQELRAITSRVAEIAPDLTLEGMLSLGEISSYGQGFLEFFNKTVVAGVLHD